jgi:hypothetical protein
MYFRLSKSGGPGEKRERLANARVFVVPNPSGLNASFPGFEHKLVWFKALRAFVDHVTPARPVRASGPRSVERPPRRSA